MDPIGLLGLLISKILGSDTEPGESLEFELIGERERGALEAGRRVDAAP